MSIYNKIMSKLFATYLMKDYFGNETNPDTVSEIFKQAKITARYFKHTKKYEFKVLDFYSYINNPNEPFFYNIKIEEPDLLRMLAVDNYSEDEKNELYYHKLLTKYEQCELDDNIFWDLSILQYFFHISKQTLVEIKRQLHLYNLYKVSVPTYNLKQRQLHSKGGRKLGSLSSITDVDLQNIENAERIIQNCVAHDYYQEFMDLHRTLIKFKRIDLNLTGAKWKFCILRYKWKLENGYTIKNSEYEKELTEKNNKYKIFDILAF